MLGTFPRTSEAKRIIIDIETYDPLLLDKGVSYVHGMGYVLGIGIKLDDEPSFYYPLRHQNETNYGFDQVRNYIHALPVGASCVGHYVVYDAGWLNHEFGWLHQGKFRDTLLMSQLEKNNRPAYSLDALSKVFGLGEKIEIGRKDIWKLPIAKVDKYCCHDVDLTAKLDDKLWEYREGQGPEREFALIPILVKMKEKGIKIDVEQLEKLKEFFIQVAKEEKIKAGVKDIWSADKVSQRFRQLGIEFPRTKLGKPSFPDWYLDSIDNSIVKSIHNSRKLEKLIQSCDGIKQSMTSGHRIHPDFFNGRSEYGGTVTGRFSCAHPNVQQIPHRTDHGKLLRSIFVPDTDLWYKFDYSQQEPKFMLHYASKLNLRDIQKWRDIYTATDADFYHPIQSAMDIERFSAKTITLATCYNMGYSKLARMMHITEEEAKNYLISFKRTVPWLSELKEYCINQAQTRGWVRTFGGRKLYFNAATASDSFNHLIQGSAADQIKEAMVQIYERLKLIPLLQVHDELGYDFNEQMINDTEFDIYVKHIMEGVFQLDFPVKVDVKPGLNWRQCD